MPCSGCVAGDQPAALSRAVSVYAAAARMQGRQTGAAFRRHCTAARSPMTPWSDEETRELVALWPSHSATQIAKRLQRPRWSVFAKVQRLRQEGLLDGGITKRFAVPPKRTRPQRAKTENPHHAAKAGASAQPPGAAARDAAVLADRARRRALSLAARRGAEGRDDVLRRRGGAKAALLRAPSADRAWPGQRILTFGAILAACRFH